ncbi:MAG: SOS response-associated peptidase [Aquaticitalea sp.]
MCYDIKASYESQLKRAERRGDQDAILEIKQNLIPYTHLPLFHVSGFSHPRLLIYTSKNPDIPEIAIWGLIPTWTPDEKSAKKIWNMTLNAKAETLFGKPAFKDSAKDKRCLIYVDGFFEHHHYKGKSYPFYIQNKHETPFALAGLWSEWINKETAEVIKSFTIITRKATPFMAKIHNNPKLDQPRMPLIVSSEFEDTWLNDVNNQQELSNFIAEIDAKANEILSAHTVRKLRGKDYLGNIEEVTGKFNYIELENDFNSQDENINQHSLF